MWIEALPASTQTKLETLECVCSLAHHDSKIHSYTPSCKQFRSQSELSLPLLVIGGRVNSESLLVVDWSVLRDCFSLLGLSILRDACFVIDGSF